MEGLQTGEKQHLQLPHAAYDVSVLVHDELPQESFQQARQLHFQTHVLVSLVEAA
jgi:hypothetical protein